MARLWLLMFGLGAIALDAYAEDCKFTAERRVDIEGGLDKVIIEAGAGELDVRGTPGGRSVGATGRACASSAELLEAIRIEARRAGDTVYLSTALPQAGLGAGRYAYIDLRVQLPAAAAVSIDDSSGDLQLSTVHAASIQDGSGSQRLRAIAGEVRIVDQSGEIELEDIGGNVVLEDSSGDIEISGVRGNVTVDADSSGELEIAKVSGTVHIVEDSSGDIEIKNVERDVVIDSDSSGSIRVEDVGGDFIVRADTSGDIVQRRVHGSVQVPQR